MNQSEPSSVLLLGLPESGKTHFLVALDIILDNQTDPDGLVHSEHARDRAYVQPLREKWLRGEKLGHTSRQATPSPHHLLVLHPSTKTETTFHVPDVAGETFDGHFATRSFPHALAIKVQQAKGIILFLHCDEESEHAIHEHPQFQESPLPEAPHAEKPSLQEAPDWTIEMSSKQVKIVEILQFIKEIRKTPLRVSVAISAWDLVEKAPAALAGEMPKNPKAFVAKRWPLLTQFLECNSIEFPHRTFGVSARGGGHSPEEVARLTNFIDAKDRVILQDGDHRSNDLTRPVRWILGLLA